jgi:hypothetical protein
LICHERISQPRKNGGCQYVRNSAKFNYRAARFHCHQLACVSRKKSRYPKLCAARGDGCFTVADDQHPRHDSGRQMPGRNFDAVDATDGNRTLLVIPPTFPASSGSIQTTMLSAIASTILHFQYVCLVKFRDDLFCFDCSAE